MEKAYVTVSAIILQYIIFMCIRYLSVNDIVSGI